MNERGRVAVDHLARTLPHGAAGCGVDSQNERVGVLVTDEDDAAVGVDRRSDDAVLAIEGSERMLPERLAVEVVGDEAEIREEGEDAISVVGDRRRRSEMVQRILDFALWGSDGATPEDPAGRALQADGEEVVAFRRGYEDSVPDEERR